MKKFPHKAFVLGLWLLIILELLGLAFVSGIAMTDFGQTIQNWVTALGWWGPLAYVGIYIIRSFVLFPATAITAMSGVLFGPLWGTVLTVLASNLSAWTSFFVGRYFRSSVKEKLSTGVLKKWDSKLRKNGFLSVLLMRLLYFPFDLTSYICGATSVTFIAFASASFIGMLTGTVMFVTLGSSLADWRYLLVALGLFLLGFAFSRVAKKYGKDVEQLHDTTTL